MDQGCRSGNTENSRHQNVVGSENLTICPSMSVWRVFAVCDLFGYSCTYAGDRSEHCLGSCLLGKKEGGKGGKKGKGGRKETKKRRVCLYGARVRDMGLGEYCHHHDLLPSIDHRTGCSFLSLSHFFMKSALQIFSLLSQMDSVIWIPLRSETVTGNIF